MEGGGWVGGGGDGEWICKDGGYFEKKNTTILKNIY